MTLLAPLLLAGLVGLALPLLAHLRGREEPRTIVFAARRFLEGGDEILSQRRTLRERLLLALRLLLLALVALALARPVSRHEADLAVLGEAHDAVLLIDGSRSMGLRIDEQSLFAASGEAAAAIAGALPAGSRIGLAGSDPALPRIELGADPQAPLAALRERLGAGDPRPGSWRLGDRLPSALALLADEGRPRVIYAIGDRSAGGLGSLPTSVGEVAVIPVAVDGPIEGPVADPPEHLGIAAAAWEAAPEIDRGALRITAEIRSYAPADPDRRRQATLALRIAGEVVTQTSVEVAAGQSASVELTHTMAGDQGPAPATLELIQPRDPLPSDDRRHLWLAADDRLSVALVNGDPSEVRTHDEVFFLATALASEGGDRRLLVRNLAPDQLERQLREGGEGALAGIDVLVLANVPAPPEDVARAITARVRAGMGLWVTVGERVEAAAYNERLGELLPLLLREPVLAGTAPGRSEAKSEGLAPAHLDHPALRGMSSDLGLLGARARRIYLLQPDAERDHAALLAYSSGAPALLSREVGRGRVALLTTSIDRDWSDIPLRPGFVPLAARLITYLGNRGGQIGASEVMVGEPWISGLPGPLTIVTPRGQRIAVAADEDGVIRFTETFEPGHYRVERGGDEAPLVFVANVDPAESDTAHQAITPPNLVGDRVLADAHVPRWRPLLALAALLLAGESLLRIRRRRRALAQRAGRS